MSSSFRSVASNAARESSGDALPPTEAFSTSSSSSSSPSSEPCSATETTLMAAAAAAAAVAAVSANGAQSSVPPLAHPFFGGFPSSLFSSQQAFSAAGSAMALAMQPTTHNAAHPPPTTASSRGAAARAGGGGVGSDGGAWPVVAYAPRLTRAAMPVMLAAQVAATAKCRNPPNRKRSGRPDQGDSDSGGDAASATEEDDGHAGGGGGEPTPPTKRARRSSKTSVFFGVSASGQDRKFQARLRVGNKVLYLGRFNTEIEAALRYDEAARHYKPPQPTTNFCVLDENQRATLVESFILSGGVVQPEFQHLFQPHMLRKYLQHQPTLRQRDPPVLPPPALPGSAMLGETSLYQYPPWMPMYPTFPTVGMMPSLAPVASAPQGQANHAGAHPFLHQTHQWTVGV